ncbi:MAG: hypothetical protein HDR26_00720, partial [Lachnospiraceae bacterium]|nr:hypothetical protein [Lachnospiraceae bacterium]
VPGIASTVRMVNAADLPLSILIDRKVLNPDWSPMEMPTMQIRMNSTYDI